MSQTAAGARTAEYYVADMRASWLRLRYVTFWRPDNKGYAYPLAWAGKYDRKTIINGGDYYTVRCGRELVRFAVP